MSVLNLRNHMAPDSRTLTFKLWTMNAREGDELLPYGDLFGAIAARQSPQTLQSVSRDLTFAIDLEEAQDDKSTARLKDHRVFYGTIVAGTPDEVPVYFDYRTGQTDSGTTPDGKWLAQVSAIVVSITSEDRFIAFESARNGITSARLARYFQLLAEQIWEKQSVEFDINPVQSPSLLTEIDSFSRIREATATVTRPNFDWDDQSHKLADLADESGGHEAEATVRAARGQALSTKNGIVAAIRSSLTNATSAMSKFRITGRKGNSDKETTITSSKHQQRTFVKVPTTADADIEGLVRDRVLSLIEAARVTFTNRQQR
ncbi:hypothetical protein [Mycobacteroides abscessus]|uniref:hypothetical protein n=3 Tax=Mycobacteroides abscessus TaxID=36809 RepID=UPI0010424835|nr:hypothetical protein [Mycobacteroides abscessus]MDM2350141.1 hypothetical protein [Mycobacteroides abscessus]MDM2360587.1 hypothetical protein [Mycobacteroides abscessus]